jgi:hypothetical protein
MKTRINKEDERLERLESMLPLYIGMTFFLIVFLVAVVLFISSLAIDPVHGQWIVDFDKAGTFGDLISGISAPIVGLLSAYLIYTSFKAQIRANRIVVEQFEKTQKEENFLYLLKEFEKLLDEIHTFSFENLQGIEAYEKVFDNLDNYLFFNFDKSDSNWFRKAYFQFSRMRQNILLLDSCLERILVMMYEREIMEVGEIHKFRLNARYKYYYNKSLFPVTNLCISLEYSAMETWGDDVSNLTPKRVETLKEEVLKTIKLIQELQQKARAIDEFFKLS